VDYSLTLLDDVEGQF